jgi:hypothetical protein
MNLHPDANQLLRVDSFTFISIAKTIILSKFNLKMVLNTHRESLLTHLYLRSKDLMRVANQLV